MIVTGEQVKKAMTDAGVNSVDHHKCGFCGYMTKYIRRGETLYFDAGCYCTPGNDLQIREWDEAAEWINMQNPIAAPALAEKFGYKEGCSN